MLKKITLVDVQSDLASAWTQTRPSAVSVPVQIAANTSVAAIPKCPGTAFVSPANSLGFMDGGVDLEYMRMFPGIQERVQAAIRDHGQTTFLGRAFLPIGSALVIPTSGKNEETFLVCAPTMFLPCDVSCTHNAYHATYAATRACLEHGGVVSHLVIPGMATGIGRIPSTEAASQMWNAVLDALAAKPQRYSIEEIVHEQPLVYSYREYFETYHADSKLDLLFGRSTTTTTTK